MSTEVRPLVRTRLPDDVAEFVRDLIVTGQVRAGDYLRLEPLATRLGTSITPVREALLTLRSEGFVNQIPRQGFRVLPFARQDVDDVYAVQAHLAGELAARACARLAGGGEDHGRDPAGHALVALRELQDALVSAHEDGDADEVERLNHAFHREVNVAAASPKLTQFLHLATRYSPRHFFARIEGWTRASAEDHETILDAFEQGDPPQARTAMADHVAKAGELLADHLAAQGFWTPEHHR